MHTGIFVRKVWCSKFQYDYIISYLIIIVSNKMIIIFPPILWTIITNYVMPFKNIIMLQCRIRLMSLISYELDIQSTSAYLDYFIILQLTKENCVIYDGTDRNYYIIVKSITAFKQFCLMSRTKRIFDIIACDYYTSFNIISL